MTTKDNSITLRIGDATHQFTIDEARAVRDELSLAIARADAEAPRKMSAWEWDEPFGAWRRRSYSLTRRTWAHVERLKGGPGWQWTVEAPDLPGPVASNHADSDEEARQSADQWMRERGWELADGEEGQGT